MKRPWRGPTLHKNVLGTYPVVTHEVANFYHFLQRNFSSLTENFTPLSLFQDALPLDIQNPPVIPGDEVWKEALKAEPQKMFGGSNAYSLQGGPLPVINGVITPINGLVTG